MASQFISDSDHENKKKGMRELEGAPWINTRISPALSRDASLSLSLDCCEGNHPLISGERFPKDKSALPDKHSLGIHLTCRNDRPSRGTHIYFFRAGMLVSRRINSEQVGLGMAECEFMRPLAASMTVPSVSPEYDD